MNAKAETTNCGRCGRRLTSATSITNGYGRTCKAKVKAAAQAAAGLEPAKAAPAKKAAKAEKAAEPAVEAKAEEQTVAAGDEQQS